MRPILKKFCASALIALNVLGCSIAGQPQTPDSAVKNAFQRCKIETTQHTVPPPVQPNTPLTHFTLTAFREAVATVCGEESRPYIVDPLILLDEEQNRSIAAEQDAWMKNHGPRGSRWFGIPATRERAMNTSKGETPHLGSFTGHPFQASIFFINPQKITSSEIGTNITHEIMHGLTTARGLPFSKTNPAYSTFQETISEVGEAVFWPLWYAGGASNTDSPRAGKWDYHHSKGTSYGALAGEEQILRQIVDLSASALQTAKQSPEEFGKSLGKVHNITYRALTSGEAAMHIYAYAMTREQRAKLYPYIHYPTDLTVPPDIKACAKTDPILQQDVERGVLRRSLPSETLHDIQACGNARRKGLDAATKQHEIKARQIFSATP